MTACLILATFLGTSAAQTVQAEDFIKQQPLSVPQAVFQPDPTTVHHQFKEDASTLGGKNPRNLKLGKRGISESTAEHGTICDHYLNCFASGEILCMECMEEKNNSFSLPLFIAVLVLVYVGHNLRWLTRVL